MEIRTAVAAIASEGICTQAVHALSAAGIRLLALTRDGGAALEMLRSLRPDLLLADSQLPVMDGCTLAKRVLEGFSLPVRPAVVLLHYREFPLQADCIRAGAVPMEKPIDISAFCRCIEDMRASHAGYTAAQLRRADQLLDALGLPDHIGRDLLKQACLACAADERCLHQRGQRLYPMLGDMFQMNTAQAERAMRHAIGRAWQSDKFDNQYRIFADTVDAGRGQPTCGEMISRLADILRLEG